MECCGDISIRKPEHTSQNITTFYSNLNEVLETGTNTAGRAVKILAQKGQKQVGLISSAERGTNIISH